MRHRLFTLSAAASLTLGLATCVLEWHSQHRGDRFFWAEWVTTPTSTHSRIVCLGGYSGDVIAAFERNNYSSPPLAQAIKRYNPPGFHVDSVDLSGLRGLGLSDSHSRFAFGKTSRNMPAFQTDFWQARCPAWLAAFAWAILPIFRAKLWSRQRPLAGFCRKCGYDVRATLDRCPECGTVPITNSFAFKSYERFLPRYRMFCRGRYNATRALRMDY